VCNILSLLNEEKTRKFFCATVDDRGGQLLRAVHLTNQLQEKFNLPKFFEVTPLDLFIQ